MIARKKIKIKINNGNVILYNMTCVSNELERCLLSYSPLKVIMTFECNLWCVFVFKLRSHYFVCVFFSLEEEEFFL